MDNRRQFARVDHEILANYSHVEAEQSADDGMAKTLNLSVGGLLLQLPREAKLDTNLKVALNLDGQIVEVLGRVARCGASSEQAGMFEVGVELLHVPDQFAARVEQYFAILSEE